MLGKHHARLPRPDTLDLSGTDGRLSPREIQVLLVPLVVSLPSLTCLKLSNNGIADAELSAILVAAQGSATLQHLYLANNQVGLASQRELAKLLGPDSTLEILDLDSCELGAEGMENLAESIRQSRRLQGLGLYNNGLGDRGVETMASILRSNVSLRRVNLSHNSISASGSSLTHLVLAMESNHSLIELDGVPGEIQLLLKRNVDAALEQDVIDSSVSIGQHVWVQSNRTWMPASVASVTEERVCIHWWMNATNAEWIRLDDKRVIRSNHTRGHEAQPAAALSANGSGSRRWVGVVSASSTTSPSSQDVVAQVDSVSPSHLGASQTEVQKSCQEDSSSPSSGAASQPAVPLCCICYEANSSIVFVPCGHLCTCTPDGTKASVCPLCRAEITTKVRVFLG